MEPAHEAINAHVDAFVEAGLPASSRPLVPAGIPLRVLVFDATATHALLQIVYRAAEPHYDDEPPAAPVDCGYPGMQEWPLAGVSLSLVTLATGQARTWVVYEPAAWGGAGRCTPYEEAARRRAEAEAAARAVGLDPSRRLEPIRRDPPLPANGCHQTLPVATVRLPVGTWSLVERHGSDAGAHGFVVVGDRIRWADARPYNPAMAGSGTIALGDAWPAGDGFVLTETYWSFQGACSASVGLTPVLK